MLCAMNQHPARRFALSLLSLLFVLAIPGLQGAPPQPGRGGYGLVVVPGTHMF